MKFDRIVRAVKLNRIEFRVHDVSLCIVNAARRAIIADVHSAAFAYDICIPDAPKTGVKVVSNTTTLHNEMLAHRFSFIPIHLSENEQEKMRAEPGRYKFTVRVKNKGAAGAAVMDVTSRDILVTDAFGVPLPASVRDAMFPPDPISGDHIIIVCLRPSATGNGLGEEVAIDAVASSSSGSVNSRWSPASICTFRNVIDTKISDQTYDLKMQSAKESATPIQTRAQFNTLDAHRCFSRDVHGEPYQFDVCIESVCGQRPEYLFYKALRYLSDRVSLLAEVIANASDKISVTLETLPNTEDFYCLTVVGEGHTLGNLLQGLLYERHVRDEHGERLTFVGYHVAHPLDQSICFKLKVVPGVVIRTFLVESLKGVVSVLDAVALEWTHPSGLDTAGILDVDAFIASVPHTIVSS